ncbi:MAG: CopG family transcriptional regulator [Patescibacteria group bacterium]|nr:CopG family transcriptional regulator [Patescibacteria group bacterium]
MKIYFTASQEQKADFQHIYERIVNYLEGQGHDVYKALYSGDVKEFSNLPEFKLNELSKEWFSQMAKADCAVVEGSYPSSIHTGYQLGQLVSQQKPTILIYKSNRNPIFANGADSSRLIKSAYDEDILEDVLDWCLEEVKNTFNRRFTFYISPEIDKMLNEATERNSVSKSEFIRQLIKKEV